MISVDEALSRVLALATPTQGEFVGLDQAAGRALLSPAISRMTQPPFDAAAMDGYAYRKADQGKQLRVIGEAAAGHPWPGTATPGSAVRIFTGAPVPIGYDRVEMQEKAHREGDLVTISMPSSGDHIRKKGSDFSEGDRVEPGRKIRAADIALMAAMNLPQVEVAKRPKVAILAGGDELIRPGGTPLPGQVISSNDLAIAAIARDAGAEVEILPIARDTENSLRESFAHAASADVLVTIGGASVGDHDLIGKVAESLGMERSFYKIAMRPGKPLMAGRVAGLAMLGLPGNPVSAMVCATLFMRPLIMAMQGLPTNQRTFRARLTADLPPEGDREHYVRARVSTDTEFPEITVFERQDSSLLSVLSRSDSLLRRPAFDPARKAGEMMDYLPLR